MVEAGSSTDADQCSASKDMESELSATNNQESTKDMFQLLAKQIEDLKSEIKLYSSRVSQNQDKLQEMQLKINKDKAKEIELKKKLDNLMKAQSLLMDSCRENTNQESVEIQTDQQHVAVNDQEINLPTTSRGCNDRRKLVRVAQSTSQTESIESTGSKSDNLDNIDDEISSQNISDNASESSYRPSEHTQTTQSTDTQTIEEVNVTASNLAWDIACQKLLHTIQENKDSYHFREPVNEKMYKDYSKYVTTPLCLREIEESLDTGNYISPLDFSKDMKIIFDNSRKYNTDKTELIYKQTTRLKKLYEDQMQEIISNWRATKKSRGSSGSKRKISDGPDDVSEEDDDSQSQLKCRPKKRRNFLSDDEETTSKSSSVIEENSDVDDDVEYDDNGSEDNEPISTRLRAAQRKADGKQSNAESSESDTEDDDSFMESSDEDQSTAYEDDCTSMDEEMENENLESLTSESAIEKFVPEDFVSVTGKVCKVFKTVKQRSYLKGKDLKLFKFLLKTKEGRHNVECVAWEDVAIHCQSKILRNQVITLEKVKVTSSKGKCYNKGDFELQLTLCKTSKIIIH